MTENHTPLAVIGAGPGGYAAAFLAADMGMSVTLIDPETTPGGVCLHPWMHSLQGPFACGPDTLPKPPRPVPGASLSAVRKSTSIRCENGKTMS